MSKTKLNKGWHVDKTVNLPLVFAMALQLGALVVWGTRMDGRLTTVENKASDQGVVIESMRTQTSTINTSLARIQERQDAASDDIKEIKDILKDELAPKRKSKKETVE